MLEKRQDKTDRTTGSLSSMVCCIAEDIRIQHVLESQDEEDRTKLALTGHTDSVKEPSDRKTLQKLKKTMVDLPNKVYSPESPFHQRDIIGSNRFDSNIKSRMVALDSNTYSLSGYSAPLLTNFKIASISYKPSAVAYRGN